MSTFDEVHGLLVDREQRIKAKAAGRAEVKARWQAVLSRVAPAYQRMEIKLLEKNVPGAEILKACKVAAGSQKATAGNDQTLFEAGVRSSAALLGVPVPEAGRSL
jgi:hypothetical protein